MARATAERNKPPIRPFQGLCQTRPDSGDRAPLKGPADKVTRNLIAIVGCGLVLLRSATCLHVALEKCFRGVASRHPDADPLVRIRTFIADQHTRQLAYATAARSATHWHRKSTNLRKRGKPWAR